LGNPELNGWVINSYSELKFDGKNYNSPFGSYQKNGFKVLYDIKIPKNGNQLVAFVQFFIKIKKYFCDDN